LGSTRLSPPSPAQLPRIFAGLEAELGRERSELAPRDIGQTSRGKGGPGGSG